jgi:L-aspartate oxidase
VASSGLHGANRLASNSLLEGLVIGHAAGTTAVAELTARSTRVAIESVRVAAGEDPGLHLDDMLYSLKALMWLRVGVERSEAPLVEARTRLEFWRRCFFRVPLAHPRSWELANMLIVATLIVESALTRRESRGTHYRTDHPAIDDVHFRKHTEFVIDQDGSPECRS